ncbi:diguanylate cyclase (GGDEF)-like protein [Rhizobium sp. SG_E_25_P2]|uniref:sensor domain-containing diguanylate cyclase n=1 Tax=Rhizobium sp. SG_E_25_P2 TaxID=2879942 RepID=UPI00247DA06F|nr:diguanylate cyclase (GGDEF)-like protein [Rhizobium sp. SG_E_25_P2]
MFDTEDQRLAALANYVVLDTEPEARFSRLTDLARMIFETSIAQISLIERDRQWYKAESGAFICQTTREEAICNHTIQSRDVLVVHDTIADPRTSGLRIVTGEPYIRFYAGAPLISPDGHAIGAFCVSDHSPRDFSDREADILRGLAQTAMDQMELRLRSSLDWLTGAASKGAFHSFAREILAPGSRQGLLALVSFDIDHFKRVNDHYGHLVGDQVLSRVALCCRTQLRHGDMIARMGGEEFTILLANTTQSVAMNVAERLRAAICALDLSDIGLPNGVTASFGVTMLEERDMSIEATLERADQALYRAKSEGRNCVRFAYGCESAAVHVA